MYFNFQFFWNFDQKIKKISEKKFLKKFQKCPKETRVLKQFLIFQNGSKGRNLKSKISQGEEEIEASLGLPCFSEGKKQII